MTLHTVHRRPDPRWALLVIPLVCLAAVIVALVLATIDARPAGAQVIVDVPTGTEVSLTPFVVMVLVGLVLPVVTGLITRIGTSDSVKALVSFVLMAIAAVITEITTTPTFDLRSVGLLFLTVLVTNTASWFQIWKPIPAGGPNAAPLHGALGIIGAPPAL
jgi:hypothetical protein